MMRAGRAGNALLALGGVVAGLGLAEVTLRMLAPRRAQIYVPDLAALYRLRPGTSEVLQAPPRQGGGTVTLRVSRDGFRGPELAQRPARRVVVYGDSFVEARFTPEPATLAGRLAAELAASGAPAEVVNAGVTGYGPDQVALRMERELAMLRPGLVVVALFAGNDGGDLVRNQLFRLGGQGRLQPQAPELDLSQRPLVEAPAGANALALVRAVRRVQRRWRGTSPALPAEPRTLAWALRECESEHAALARPPRVTNLFIDHYDADLALKPLGEPARHKRALLRAVLARLRDEAARAAAPVLLLVIPDWRDLCAECAHRAEAAAHPEYRPSALTDALEEIARAERIPVLNLFPAFRERGDALYHAGDGHWNEQGQAEAARLLAARVAAEGWLR
jgi:lysophospholipase L1-like esterase